VSHPERGKLFLTSGSTASGREAHIAEESHSVWLYLTVAHGKQVEADVWLLNTPDAPEEPGEEPYRGRQAPPPLPARLVRPGGVLAVADETHWSLLWSSDGHAVAALLDHAPIGFAVAGMKTGWARYAGRGGADWALPWDMAEFLARFQGRRGGPQAR
jgi:hypothetical protein